MNVSRHAQASLIGLTLILGGCSLSPTTPTPSASPAMEKGTPMMSAEPNAMDMSKLTGVAMLDGKMLDIWEGGEMMVMEGDLMLGDAKVMLDGKVMMKDGTVKKMGDAEVMMKDGTVKKMDTRMVIDAKRVMMAPQEGMEKTKGDAMMEKKEGSQGAGTYDEYAASKIAMAKEGKVILFFKASWCPSCNAVNADINKNLSSIPANTHILRVDYDSASELKSKYGVTSQHTFVQVDADGQELKQWSGGSTLSNILSKII